MEPEELAAKLETLIIGAGKVLADGILTVQDYLYNQIVKVLKDLELDDNGYIIQSASNRKIISEAITAIDVKVKTSSYQAQVENYLGTINKIDALNITYFEAISAAFKPNKQFLANLQKNTITQLENLLFNSGFQSQIKIPLAQVLNQNINSGGSFTGLLEQVKQYIKGSASVDGKLLKYVKTITRDTLFDYSRAFQQAVSSDLGLTWYCYSGGLMDKSRDFCIEHAGHYYPQAQVESWADLDWQGKNPDTTASSIFIYAGGFSCGHSLIPVAIEAVPPEDIAMAKLEGYA